MKEWIFQFEQIYLLHKKKTMDRTTFLTTSFFLLLRVLFLSLTPAIICCGLLNKNFLSPTQFGFGSHSDTDKPKSNLMDVYIVSFSHTYTEKHIYICERVIIRVLIFDYLLSHLKKKIVLRWYCRKSSDVRLKKGNVMLKRKNVLHVVSGIRNGAQRFSV